MASRRQYRALESWLVIAIAVHSLAIGAILLFFTRWGTTLGGFSDVSPLFFARQGGIFHVVVAAGYLLDFFRYRSVAFLLLAKILAVVFLTGIMVVEPHASWTVPLSAVGDGGMALAIYLVHRRSANPGLSG